MEAAKRVAKNTGILYARMAITVLISRYSTRLILAALGVADFGLFNVVGGVISMLGFLNSSMAAATQRFMSFAQGEGELENEIAKVSACHNPLYQLPVGTIVVRVDPQYYRPTEVDLLIGDPKKSKTKLGWEPKYDLAGLVKEMVESDLKHA